jgi:hypothetical protein
MEFTWRADGARQVVRVPIGEHPEWRGVITHVRVDPIEDEPAPATSATTRGQIDIGAIRLRGTSSPATRD